MGKALPNRPEAGSGDVDRTTELVTYNDDGTTDVSYPTLGELPPVSRIDYDGTLEHLSAELARLESLDRQMEGDDNWYVHRDRRLDRIMMSATAEHALELCDNLRHVFEAYSSCTDLLDHETKNSRFTAAELLEAYYKKVGKINPEAPSKQKPEKDFLNLPDYGLVSLRVPNDVEPFNYGYSVKYTIGMRHLSTSIRGWMHGYGEELWRNFRKPLEQKSGFTDGCIEQNQGKVSITPSVRRHHGLTDEEVAYAIFLNSYGDDIWSHLRFCPDFYPQFIYPYVKDDKETDPFMWALDRAEIAIATVIQMRQFHDCPLRYIKSTYEKTAGMACNTLDKRLLEPKEYDLDEKGQALLDAASQYGPEMAMFVLENVDVLEVSMFEDARVKELLGKWNTCIANGLNVYRAIDYFKLCGDFIFTLEIITAIYGGIDKPWWFKEDFDLTVYGHGDEVLNIAQKAGFAFTQAYDLCVKGGLELVAVEGVSKETAIDLTIMILKGFGIGNEERAKRVVKFATDFLNTVGVEDRQDALALFIKHAERQRSRDPLVGRLQGTDAGIQFPGITSLACLALGEKRMEADKVDDDTLQVAHIEAASAIFGQEFGKRASLPPRIREQFLSLGDASPLNDGVRMLTSDTSAPKLLAAADHDTSPHKSPTLGVLEFYDRVFKECGWLDREVIHVYFAFLSLKMPNPFNPPKGFLSFIQKFNDIPNKEYVHAVCVHPHQRMGQAEKNAEAIAARYFVLSDLVDAWVLGIFTEQEFMDVCNWIAVDIDPSELGKIETEVRESAARYVSLDEDGNESPAPLDEEHIQIKIRIKIMDIERESRLERLETVINSMGMLALANALAIGGVLPQELLSKFLDDKVAFFTATNPMTPEYKEYTEAVNRAFGSLEKRAACVKTLKQMIDLGVFDTEKLRVEFSKDSSGPNVHRVLHAVSIDMSIFENSLRLVKEFEASVIKTANVMGRGVNNRIAHEQYLDVLTALNKLLRNRGVSFITDGFVDTIFEAFSKMGAFPMIFAEIQAFRHRVLGKSLKNPAVGSATELSVSLMAAVAAIDLIRKDVRVDALEGPEEKISSNYEGCGRSPFSVPLGSIRTALNDAVGPIKKLIKEARLRDLGLVSVGGKVHVKRPIDSQRFNAFGHLMGLNQTSFHLLHANCSLNLQPVPSAAEFAWQVKALAQFGVIDLQNQFELQIGAPGRLNVPDCAILGSCIILSTCEDGAVDYDDPSAFCTNQDNLTGARIMAYDAYDSCLQNLTLPFMEGLDGRTDMLGRKNPEDARTYQLVHTVLIQAQTGKGPFGKFAEEFKKRYRAIMEKYEIDWVLNEKWLYVNGDDRRDNEASQRHFETVKTCTKAYFDCADDYESTGIEEGIVFEVRELLTWLEVQVKADQAELFDEENPCAEMKALLDF